MANLIISRVCNIDCDYCFAREALRPSPNSSENYVAPDTFETWLDFLDRSNIDEIRLLGGEPTHHPQFGLLLERSLERGKKILLFSHGGFSEEILGLLESLPDERLRVMVNISARSSRGNRLQKRRRITLKRLGSRVILGYTIAHTDLHLESLLKLIDRFSLCRVIRLGLAQPVWEGSNTYLHPKQYPIIGRKIIEFGKMAKDMDIKIEFDCGFVPCMFSSQDREWLEQAFPNLGWHCNPVLDLNIDGRSFHCFPLAQKTFVYFQDGQKADQIRAQMTESLRLYRIAGIYPECSHCSLKAKGNCPGGCMSLTLCRYRETDLAIRCSV